MDNWWQVNLAYHKSLLVLLQFQVAGCSVGVDDVQVRVRQVL